VLFRSGSAPSPFDLFMLSIGTCAGYYVLTFLQQRGLST
jgi:putative redox protein